MHGAIARHLALDHARLDALLAQATRQPDAIDLEPFHLFRKGLLRHIGLEEKILFPRAKKIFGAMVPGVDELRADHSRLAALLVPSPTPALVAQLRALLADHNRREEEENGVYELCERLLSGEEDEVVAAMEQAPEVPVRPYYDGRLPKQLQG